MGRLPEEDNLYEKKPVVQWTMINKYFCGQVKCNKTTKIKIYKNRHKPIWSKTWNITKGNLKKA